jgi:hypothetical protein
MEARAQRGLSVRCRIEPGEFPELHEDLTQLNSRERTHRLRLLASIGLALVGNRDVTRLLGLGVAAAAGAMVAGAGGEGGDVGEGGGQVSNALDHEYLDEMALVAVNR